MKWVYKITLILFLIIAVTAAAGSLFYYTRINVYGEESAYAFRAYPQYHFSLIINNEGEVYWENFKKGALDAAKNKNVAIEVNFVDDPNINSKTVEYIYIANKSKVDGIIVAGENTTEYIKALESATNDGINTVVGVFEAVNSHRLCYVGTNYYELGADAGRLIKKIGDSGEAVELAVILPSERQNGSPDTTNTQQEMLLRGLRSVPIGITRILYRTSDLLGAEDQIRSILTEYPDIGVIFCTNSKDTLSAAHVIVERNLVGKVLIVGIDMTDEIANYVRKDIVFGILDRNGYDAGYRSVGALYDSIGGRFNSSYIDIYTSVYTAENISRYAKH